jgi:peptidoglycan/xylan/chitin deacetylase (PgdA/CDA1 family)
MRLFDERRIPITLNVCAQAVERNAEIADAIASSDHDLCCHGERFARQFLMMAEEERAVIANSVRSLERLVGRRPLGWQSRYSPSGRTRALLVEHGGFLYDSDSYADDLPYWVDVGGRAHLIVPHSFTNNDNRLATAKLGTADDFYDHLASAFRVLHAEGAAAPKMMTVSLHSRISGQPARTEGIARFLDLVGSHERVWMAKRSDVARHWMKTHPAGSAA